MSSTINNPQDIRFYKKLIRLTDQQLASIHIHLARDANFFQKHIFLFRNILFKKTILKLLAQKETRLNEKEALDEMMAELKAIEADTQEWATTGTDELDYIRVMVHGLRDISGEEVEEATTEENGAKKERKLEYRLKINECS